MKRLSTWFAVFGFLVINAVFVWAYDAPYSGAQVDQSVNVGTQIHSATGCIESDGSGNITGSGEACGAGGSGGVEEAPEDGNPYSRQDAGWVISPGASGGVTGPGSSEDDQVATFSGTTGNALSAVPVKIDSSGNVTNVSLLDVNASADPAFLNKDSDSPGSDKAAGVYPSQYLSGADGSEFTETGMQVKIAGTLTETTGIVNVAGMVSGEMIGDFEYGLLCAGSYSKGDVVAIQNNANALLLFDNSTPTGPAAGILANACTAGNVGVIMTKGYHKDTGYTANVASTVWGGTAGAVVTTNPDTGGSTGDLIQVVGRQYPDNVVAFDFGRGYGYKE